MDYFRDFVSPNSLMQGDNLFSATKAFRLTFETDGNLLLYVIDDVTLPQDITQGRYIIPIWESGTSGRGFVTGTHCDMQEDGNFVMYADPPPGRRFPIWDSATQGNPGAFLRCQDDGNLVIYSPNGSAIWWTNTYAGPR